ncbi:MAG: hypothetical protein U5P41_14420 [Gammaproteobacteria bacterium]|nr:hypothetical protein [Gammaproteobacteria bacterium]
MERHGEVIEHCRQQRRQVQQAEQDLPESVEIESVAVPEDITECDKGYGIFTRSRGGYFVLAREVADAFYAANPNELPYECRDDSRLL